MIGLTIPTTFTAVDKFTATVMKMGNGITAFASRAEILSAKANRWFDKLTPTLSSASKKLLDFAKSAAVASAIVAAITFGGKSIMDYEVALHSLQAVTGESYKLFEGQIESIAIKSKKSAIDVAGAFEVIGSAMSQYLKDPIALGQITEAGITLAKASRQELIPTLESLTGIMNQFKLGANEANAVINRLSAGEIVGALRTSEVATALQEFGASAQLANVNLGESVALVEVLRKQMSAPQIGNASKNIMVVLNAAKGLAKRARKELTKNGVNLGMLMDNKISLGARLTELSKILKDPVAMVKVFGRENLTAGQIILGNLDTYKKWEKEIQATNQANKQAADNSDTLANRLTEVKNAFVNALVSGGGFDNAMSELKDTLGFVGDNMGTLLKWGLRILGFFALWKAILITTSVVLTAYNIILGITGALTGVASIAISRSTIAMRAYQITLWLVTAAQWALNAAMTANPIGLIIVAIAALIALVTAIITHWNSWGAAMSLVLGPLGMVVSMVMSFVDNWGMITKAFREGGIVAGLKAIGAVILDSLLKPIEQFLSLIGSITGAKWAKDAANAIYHFRKDLGVNVSGETADDNTAPAALPPTLLIQQQRAKDDRDKKAMSQYLGINIIDPGGYVGGTQQNGPQAIPVTISTTKGVR